MIKYTYLLLVVAQLTHAAANEFDSKKVELRCCVEALQKFDIWGTFGRMREQGGRADCIESSLGRLHKKELKHSFAEIIANDPDVERIGRKIMDRTLSLPPVKWRLSVAEDWLEGIDGDLSAVACSALSISPASWRATEDCLEDRNLAKVACFLEKYRDLFAGHIEEMLGEKISGLAFHKSVYDIITQNRDRKLSDKQKTYYMAARHALALCMSALPSSFYADVVCGTCTDSCGNYCCDGTPESTEEKRSRWRKEQRAKNLKTTPLIERSLEPVRDNALIKKMLPVQTHFRSAQEKALERAAQRVKDIRVRPSDEIAYSPFGVGKRSRRD